MHIILSTGLRGVLLSKVDNIKMAGHSCDRTWFVEKSLEDHRGT